MHCVAPRTGLYRTGGTERFRRKTMKRSSGTLVFLRIFVSVLAIVFAVGYYGHVRAQSGTGSVRVPLRPLAPLSSTDTKMRRNTSVPEDRFIVFLLNRSVR